MWCDVLCYAVYSQYLRWQQYITVSCLSENILVRCFIHRDFIRIIITMIIRIMLIIIRTRIYIYKVKWDGKNEVIPSTSHSRDKYHRTENIYSSKNMLLPERWYHKSSTTTNSSILAYLRMFAAVCSHTLIVYGIHNRKWSHTMCSSQGLFLLFTTILVASHLVFIERKYAKIVSDVKHYRTQLATTKDCLSLKHTHAYTRTHAPTQTDLSLCACASVLYIRACKNRLKKNRSWT